MRYWWVNHKQTFRHEVDNGYIWCPKTKKNGARNHFYETLREVRQGDLVFSYADAKLQAVGVAKESCYSCPKPNEFGAVGDAWNDIGWRVDVSFTKFRAPLRIKSVIGRIQTLLPQQYSPIQSTGDGNQGAYLAEISYDLAAELIELAEPALNVLLGAYSVVQRTDHVLSHQPEIIIDWEDRIQTAISGRTDVTETTRHALVAARRGQGQFRQGVLKWERECRITHVGNPTHLIASHIKPWREAEDDERLSEANGLMLTPSIDHLFDRGFISFGDDGEVLISPNSDKDSLAKMGVAQDQPIFVGKFNSDQKHFLNYHRERIFLKSAI